MASMDKPDIDEVVLTVDGKQHRVLPLEIEFDAPPSKSSGQWVLRAFDPVHERDLVFPMNAISNWKAAA